MITVILALNKNSCKRGNVSAPYHAFIIPVLISLRIVVSNVRLTVLPLLLQVHYYLPLFLSFSLCITKFHCSRQAGKALTGVTTMKHA